jgi:hypothetical protein
VERRYSSYSYLTSALDGDEWSASRPCHALPQGKRPPVPIGQEAGWALEPVWTQRIDEKSSASVLSEFPTKILYAFLISVIQATCPTHLFLQASRRFLIKLSDERCALIFHLPQACYTSCPASRLLLEMITIIIFRKEYKL